MDFTVHAQRADLTRNFRVFFAAEVENENDVLLHVLSPPADVKLEWVQKKYSAGMSEMQGDLH